MHADNLELLRMLIDTEHWHRVSTMDDEQVEDALQLLERRSGYQFDVSRCKRDVSATNPIHARRFFPTFHGRSNPFAVANRTTWLFVKSDAPREVGGGKNDVSRRFRDNQELPLVEDLVLTSSTLSGFVR